LHIIFVTIFAGIRKVSIILGAAALAGTRIA
jgi:hypothetical protein